jgi:hypothetical protein
VLSGSHYGVHLRFSAVTPTSGLRYSTLRAAQAAEAAQDAAAAAGGGTSGSGAAARRNQHLARRSARNKDKLFVAAEKCVAALPVALSRQSGADPVQHSDGQDFSPPKERVDPIVSTQLLELFAEDVRSTVAGLLA